MKKIYFDGCSWCWGAELQDPFQSRFSKLVCDHYNAEEYNISRRGASNARMVRQLLVDHKDLSEFDLVVIQMTYPQRMEYYDRDKKRFVENRNWSQTAKLSLNQLREATWCKEQKKLLLDNAELDSKDKAWLDYYKYIYEDEYGDVYDDMYATAIRSYCKVQGVPLILATTKKKKHSKIEFDIYCGDVPRATNGHPNEEGHSITAMRIVDEDIL